MKLYSLISLQQLQTSKEADDSLSPIVLNFQYIFALLRWIFFLFAQIIFILLDSVSSLPGVNQE